MDKLNCWEFKKCGRIPGGGRVDELGMCPSFLETRTDKINCGKNGGRACWVISGTFCNGCVQGVYAAKILNCMKCDFYKLVAEEEGAGFKNSKYILSVLA